MEKIFLGVKRKYTGAIFNHMTLLKTLHAIITNMERITLKNIYLKTTVESNYHESPENVKNSR